MPAKHKVDWAAVEPVWRAGIMSKLEMSKVFGISRAALDKHFDKLGIERDLSERIRSAARAKVARDQVTAMVAPISEREIVAVNAALSADVQQRHRGQLEAAQSLAYRLMGELEATTGKPMELADLIRAVQDHDPGALPAVMRFASLSNRVGTAEKLAKTFAALIALERQAYGLDEDGKNKADATIEDVLRAVHGM